MPKLWNETIEAHRRDVRHAIMHAAAALVTEHGLHSVTMSQIADVTGIGRATLYKYFPDVQAILIAWHDDQVARHLEQLTEIRDGTGDASNRLEAVVEAYAYQVYERPHTTELAAFVHRGAHLVKAQEHLNDFVRDLLAEAAKSGEIRDDVSPDELANYCLHALTAASSLPSRAAVRRLVTITLTGLHSRS